MSRDLTSGLFWLGLALFVCFQSWTVLKLGTLRQPGPGFFPFWSGAILGVFSLHLVARSLRSSSAVVEKLRWPVPLLVLGALLTYLVFLEALGFVILTFCFMALLFRSGALSWLKSAAFSALAALVVYALFRLWLQVQLPRGLLGL